MCAYSNLSLVRLICICMQDSVDCYINNTVTSPGEYSQHENILQSHTPPPRDTLMLILFICLHSYKYIH